MAKEISQYLPTGKWQIFTFISELTGERPVPRLDSISVHGRSMNPAFTLGVIKAAENICELLDLSWSACQGNFGIPPRSQELKANAFEVVGMIVDTWDHCVDAHPWHRHEFAFR